MSSTTASARESVILGRLRETYEGSGYQFFVHPSPELLPSFLRPYSPDAIAVRGDEGIVIEVAGRSETTTGPKLAALAERVAAARGWRLDVYSTADFPREPVIEPPTAIQFAEQVADIDELAQAGQTGAALLLGWSALEAAARFLLPANRTRRPLLAEQVVEGLTAFGAIEQEAADELRALAELHDRVLHGDANAAVSPETVQSLLAHLHELRELVSAARQ